MSDKPLDIASLLRLALSDPAPRGMEKRVMDRLTSVKTAVEFGRLLGVAPIEWLRGDGPNDDEEDDK